MRDKRLSLIEDGSVFTQSAGLDSIKTDGVEPVASLLPAASLSRTNPDLSALAFWRERCELLEKQLARVDRTLQESEKACRELQQQVEMAKKVHDRGTALSLIKRMSSDDVQALLKDMGLTQYCERFSEHNINGQKLVALNDHLLESGLLIKNKFHCLKIMQVIRGNFRVMTIHH